MRRRGVQLKELHIVRDVDGPDEVDRPPLPELADARQRHHTKPGVRGIDSVVEDHPERRRVFGLSRLLAVAVVPDLSV